MKKIVFLCIVLSFSKIVLGACPQINSSEVPNGSVSSASFTAKRINQNNTDINTIFFCREPRPLSHYLLSYSKNDFIGNTAGTDKVSLGNFSNSVNVSANVLITNPNPIANFPLRKQTNRVIAKAPGTWGERTVWHFYKRIPSSNICNWNIHSSIRNYLRANPASFVLQNSNINNPAIISDTAFDWSIAKLDNAVLQNTNGKTVRADIYFYWLQNRVRGGGQQYGGNWVSGSHRYCHFAVALELKLKTSNANNNYNSAYNIDEQGEYGIEIGVRVQNN